MSKYPLRQLHKKIGILIKDKYLIFDSIEISEGGIAIEGEFVLTEGKNVLVSLHIPGGKNMVFIRSVVKTTAARGHLVCHGLEFKSLSLSVRREIRSFVSTWGPSGEKNER